MRRSKVHISFQRVDAEARHARETAQYRSASQSSIPVVVERKPEDLWMEKHPEGVNFLDWWRAWADGYPDEESVQVYNSLWPDNPERHMLLVEDDDA